MLDLHWRSIEEEKARIKVFREQIEKLKVVKQLKEEPSENDVVKIGVVMNHERM